MESSVFVAVWILGGEGLAAAEAGSGDDDGTRGIVNRIVAASDTVAGCFDPAEEGFGIGKHETSLDRVVRRGVEHPHYEKKTFFVPQPLKSG